MRVKHLCINPMTKLSIQSKVNIFLHNWLYQGKWNKASGNCNIGWTLLVEVQNSHIDFFLLCFADFFRFFLDSNKEETHLKFCLKTHSQNYIQLIFIMLLMSVRKKDVFLCNVCKYCKLYNPQIILKDAKCIEEKYILVHKCKGTVYHSWYTDLLKWTDVLFC